MLWRYSNLPRQRKCGRVPVGPFVELRHSPDVGAGYGGVAHCGSVWTCPCCSARILARRREEIQSGIETWLSVPGRQIAMLTLTMRHARSDPLAQLWDSLSPAWAAVTSGKRWIAEKQTFGCVGFLRIVEVTYGSSGWHVHVHSLLFLDRAAGPVSPDGLGGWLDSMLGRWTRALERRGRRPSLRRAQRLELVGADGDALGAYFAKAVDQELTVPQSMALEFTRGASKASRAAVGGRSPWGILSDLVSGDADGLGLWHEYERASHRRRQMTWSRGLRQLLIPDVDEQSDDEIVDAAATDGKDALCPIETGGAPRHLLAIA